MSFHPGTTNLFGPVEFDETENPIKTKYGPFYEYGQIYSLNVSCSKNYGTESNPKHCVYIEAKKGSEKFELFAIMPDYRVIDTHMFSGADIIKIQQIVSKHAYEICAAGTFGYLYDSGYKELLQCPQPPIEHGPYFPFMSMNEETEITVSGNYGTYDDPEYEVYIERPTEEGDFATLIVEMPLMTVKFRKKMEDSEVIDLMRLIGCNRNNLLECGERGCGNA